MLRIDGRNVSFSGASVIDEKVVAHMNASYNGGSEIYTNMNVIAIDLYTANKAAVDADFAQFCDEMMAAVVAAGMNPTEIVDNTGKI